MEAAQAFGLSRPVFYVTQRCSSAKACPRLVPRKRGPKRPHKLRRRSDGRPARGYRRGWTDAQSEELAAVLAQRCGIEAHLRRCQPQRLFSKRITFVM